MATMPFGQMFSTCALASLVLFYSQLTLCLPTASIDSGPLAGTTTLLTTTSGTSPTTITVNKFYGIRYASASRFSTATSPATTPATFTATTKPSACYQATAVPNPVNLSPYQVPGQSEDCLFLNVFAPATPPPTGSNYTTMIWIHGGSLRDGYSADPIYDGSAFAAFQNVIIVSINYRLNAFGFPNFNVTNGTVANLGIDDQRKAMAWVQRNIANFGGNASSIAIFGESAGAWSVDIHLTAYTPTTRPFQAAIMESSQISVGPVNFQLESSWDQLLQAVGCPTGTTTAAQIQCMTQPNVTATTIYNAVKSNALSGVQFPSYPDNVTQFNPAGRFNNAGVPVLLGTNADEYRALTPTTYTSAGAFTNYVHTLVSNLYTSATSSSSSSSSYSSAIVKAFPTGTTPGVNENFDRVAQLNTLAILQCPTGDLGLALAQLGIAPVWRYYYDASFPNWEPDLPALDNDGGLEVFHSSELPEVFDTFPGGPVNPILSSSAGLFPTTSPNNQPLPQQTTLANYMNFYWAHFAKSPSFGPVLTQTNWPSLATTGTNQVAVFQTPYPTLTVATNLDSNCPLLQPLTTICGAEAGCSGGV